MNASIELPREKPPRSGTLKYKVFLYIGDLFGVVNGQEAMEAELDRESFVFNYYMNLRARDDSLKGKIEGDGHSDTVHLKKIETGTQ